MSVYYNDNDPYCVQWLRNLIAAGHLPDGEVDDRPIQSVSSGDVRRFGQCHFFAGIGGWPLALRLAGWGDDPVWTGSCPCQPFSNASHGRASGTKDPRHLWREWLRLITECRPTAVFGEQVASAIDWAIEVQHDLERENYQFAARIIPAAAVGADHRRARLWFSAHTNVCAEHGGAKYAEAQVLPWGSSIAGGVLSPNGLSSSLARRSACKGFGNAIVPQVAAEFVSAFMECRP